MLERIFIVILSGVFSLVATSYGAIVLGKVLCIIFTFAFCFLMLMIMFREETHPHLNKK